LSAKEFLDLADVPAAVKWFAHIANPQTRRAYQKLSRTSCASRASACLAQRPGEEGLWRGHDALQALGRLVALRIPRLWRTVGDG